MATEYEKLVEMLTQLEGNTINGVVPTDSSGATFGIGIDLGQTSEKALAAAGVSPALINKFKAAKLFGKKGKDAKAALKAANLTLTDAERAELNQKMISAKQASFNAAYKKATGKDASALSENQRLALQSAYFNLGAGGTAKTGLFFASGGGLTNLSKQLANNQFDDAAKNLATWSRLGTENPHSRRAAEATLFAGGTDYSDIGTMRDIINKGGVDKYRSSFGQETVAITTDDPYAQGVVPTRFERAMDFESPYESQFNDPFQPAFELPSAPVAQQPAEPQYASMEDLLVDRSLMNPFDRYGGVV